MTLRLVNDTKRRAVVARAASVLDCSVRAETQERRPWPEAREDRRSRTTRIERLQRQAARHGGVPAAARSRPAYKRAGSDPELTLVAKLSQATPCPGTAVVPSGAVARAVSELGGERGEVAGRTRPDADQRVVQRRDQRGAVAVGERLDDRLADGLGSGAAGRLAPRERRAAARARPRARGRSRRAAPPRAPPPPRARRLRRAAPTASRGAAPSGTAPRRTATAPSGRAPRRARDPPRPARAAPAGRWRAGRGTRRAASARRAAPRPRSAAPDGCRAAASRAARRARGPRRPARPSPGEAR